MNKIAFLTRSLNYGGAERQLVALAKGLSMLGVQVVVGAFYGKGPLEAELRQAGIPIQDLRKEGRWDVLAFGQRLYRWLRQERPEIFYGFLVVPNIVCAAIRCFMPRMRVVWGVRASDMDFGYYDWTAKATFVLSSWVARYADLIIANSEAGRSFHVAHGYPAARVVVITNGIDTHHFRIDRSSRTALRAQWLVKEGEIVVGVVARLDPMKDHLTLVEAAALVLAARPNVRFVCIGDGPPTYAELLKSRCNGLGIGESITWVGTEHDMLPVYNAFDLLALSSKTEGFPNVIGEAMACGLRCVSTNVGDAAEIMGEMGRTVPANDPQALAAAILSELATPDTIGPCARRQRIIERFSLDAMVLKTKEVLSILAAGD